MRREQVGQPQGGAAGRGFTLVELVAIVAILGLLASIALPRFITLGDAAEVAVRQSLVAAIETTMGMAQAACFAQPGCSAEDVFQSIELGGESVAMLGAWPRASSGGLGRALRFDNVAVAYERNTVIFTIDADCTVRYRHPLHLRRPEIGGDSTCA